MRRGICVLIRGLHIQLIRGSAPVIVAFTQFDRAVAIEGGSSQGPAHAQGSTSRAAPCSVGNTDRFMTGSRTRAASAPARSSSQVSKPRIAPVPLLWSAALRVHQDILSEPQLSTSIFRRISSRLYIWFRVGRSREYNHLADSGYY